MMENRFYNGEAWPVNPAGLAQRVQGPKGGMADEDWWLRNNDRRREQADPPFTYFNENPISKRNFQASCLPRDHSRRVFHELAHQGHSFTEGTLSAMKGDRSFRRAMRQRYGEVMLRKPGVPGPPKPALRSASEPSLASIKEHHVASNGVFPGKPQMMESATSSLMRRGGGDAMSKVSSAAPMKSQSAQRSALQPPAHAPARSQVSACAPSQASPISPRDRMALAQVTADSGFAASNVSRAEEAGEPSAVGMSNLTISDFYSWRPRLLR
mmetsp:Transcript_64107/g.111803  ORF Transcript_64107/g.111803 Transcript_64107/m.111803 type:complete len:269 (-) Transcript_64107:61-867(-)